LAIPSLSPQELRRRVDQGQPLSLLDVREDFERGLAVIAGPPEVLQLHVPLGQLPTHLKAIRAASRDRPLIVYCHHGVRSGLAAQWLRAQGLPQVENLDGGIEAWSLEVDPTVPRY
jgi:rhodanese-related sulfurtransferase